MQEWELAMTVWALRSQGSLWSSVTKIYQWKKVFPLGGILLDSCPSQVSISFFPHKFSGHSFILGPSILVILASLYISSFPSSDVIDESSFLFLYLVHLLWEGVGSWILISMWFSVIRETAFSPLQVSDGTVLEVNLNYCVVSQNVPSWLLPMIDRGIVAQNGEWK